MPQARIKINKGNYLFIESLFYENILLATTYTNFYSWNIPELLVLLEILIMTHRGREPK